MEGIRSLEISKKVNEISVLSNSIPGVVIVHELPHLNILFMSEVGLKLLNKDWTEIKQMSHEEFQKRFFNEEDAKQNTPKIVRLLEINTDVPVSYFQQVRTSKSQEWDWFMSSTKVLLRDDYLKPVLLITIAMKIDPQDYFTTKAARLLEENEFLRKHYDDFAQLTKREREILRLIALGKSASQIATCLYISETTVETHRKNIKRKIKINSPNDLYMFTHAFNLV